MRPLLGHQGEVKNGLMVQTLLNLDGNQNWQCSKLGPSESTPTDTRPKMKKIRHKWSRKELKEIFYCFYYALENPSEACTTGKTYKLW